jgi:ABC-type uncharacterized transport system substrate-binding protein
MNRRAIITLLRGAAAWPVAAWAQQDERMRRIGYATASALQKASRSVPIVFASVTDPVGGGLVASLARPGGNATGFVSSEFGFAGKWLELLKEVEPRVKRVAVLRNAAIASQIALFGSIQSVAPSFGVELSPIDTSDAGEIERAVTAFAREPNGGLIAAPGAGVILHRELIVMLAARHRLPAVYAYRGHVASGGLISYGADQGRQLPTGGQLCQPHPQGRKASRPARAGADKIRTGNQPEDRGGPRPRYAGNRARSRRRGH